MTGIDQVAEIIAGHQPEASSPATSALLAKLEEVYGTTRLAVLFYGSCLRHHDHFDGLLDLYLIVTSYREAYRGRSLLAAGNHLLPPNVFYLEAEAGGKIVRCKYAVLTLNDFRTGCSRWFHPYIWGRFAQPCALLHCASAEIGQALHRARAAAVVSFCRAVVPCLEPVFTSRELWTTGLALSYASELRPEKPGQGEKLYTTDREYFDRLTPAALAATGFRGTGGVSAMSLGSPFGCTRGTPPGISRGAQTRPFAALPPWSF